ncbi:MAG: Fe-S cluster assembly ATPase SufC [bacterium]|nr:Fe-S cluster assembly ATPase SufC [bacterium]
MLKRSTSKAAKLQIKNLHATSGNTKILNGVSLVVSSGETHIIMGQNGSGKSTLLAVLMGHPKYQVTRGSVKLNSTDLLKLTVPERAQAGIFLGFQHPQVVAGVGFGNFIRIARNTVTMANDPKAEAIGPGPFVPILKAEMDRLKMDTAFVSRSINEGFSGGEKKKSEVLQMALLQPRIAFLDEIDSGLDIDALKIVIQELLAVQKQQGMGLVLVSHNPKILEFLQPDKIHIMSKGRIIAEGTTDIIRKLESGGYEAFLKR